MAPKGYIESMLADREKIILTTRQHWFVLFASIAFELFALIVILIAGVLAAMILPGFLGLPGTILAVIIPVMGLIPIGSGFIDTLQWYNRQYIVSTRRVIQISGVINKNVTDSSLEKVNDVKMSQSVLGRVFGYGDVEILTASELGVNLFKRIENPIRFKTAMLNAKENLERGEESISKGDDVPGLIAQLNSLREKGILSDEEFQQKKAHLLSKL